MARKNGGIVGADDVENADADTGVDGETFALLTEAPDDWEFSTVLDQSPTQVEFETPGDTFIGEYRERRTIQPEKGGDPFDLLIFYGRDGQPYSISPSYKLDRAEKDGVFEKDAWYRIVMVQAIDTGRKDNPLKDFRIDRKN